ncbi:hypothetical protein L2E82_28045 [Cichorium intybus]|uniref:Uncharacterized protein n=1 Tax=Cichorium intybus TaxID=13427 RepID=A0ACB9CVC7_CICIN|nr:hypothetical protein L2E82_28045 [Cichorium intybus]
MKLEGLGFEFFDGFPLIETTDGIPGTPSMESKSRGVIWRELNLCHVLWNCARCIESSLLLCHKSLNFSGTQSVIDPLPVASRYKVKEYVILPLLLYIAMSSIHP